FSGLLRFMLTHGMVPQKHRPSERRQAPPRLARPTMTRQSDACHWEKPKARVRASPSRDLRDGAEDRRPSRHSAAAKYEPNRRPITRRGEALGVTGNAQVGHALM